MPRDYAIDAYAVPDSASGSVILHWKKDSAGSYIIEKKILADNKFSWKKIAEISSADSFTDSVSTDKFHTPIEYRIKMQLDDYSSAYCYISTSVGSLLLDKAENLLLLVDDYVYSNLNQKVNEYKKLFIADGYRVTLLSVPRQDSFDTVNIKLTKHLIDSINQIEPLSYITILGHAAVPYSGYDAVDGHPDHIGAWPCDAFYVQFHDHWSDSLVDAHSAADPRNINIPGDGKFDQLFIYDSVKIAIGRIDFSNLPDLYKSELQLYSDYIDRVSAYKHGELLLNKSAAIADGFGTDYNEITAAEGWQNGLSLFGSESANSVPALVPYLVNHPDFYVYACNSGSFNSLKDQFYSQYLDTANFNCGIISLMGSYLADWDSQNNILRCLTAHSALNAFFGGRPFWRLEDLNIDATTGEIYKKAINNSNFYNSTNLYGFRMLHIALMGDPTIRMFEVPAAKSFSAESTAGGIELNWSLPDNHTDLSADIYRASSIDSEFVKIRSESEFSGITNFFDSLGTASDIYMIRLKPSAINSRSAEFSRSGLGIFASASSLVKENSDPEIKICKSAGRIEIQSNENISEIEIFDSAFRRAENYKNIQSNSFFVETGNISDRIFFIKITINGKIIFKKIVN